MYIIVVGGGKVGYYLSKTLIAEGHEVLIIEQDTKKCDRISEELGGIVMRGDGCEAATLAEVGTGRADMLIAVTGDDEDNLVSCQVAKKRFNVPRTIARINNPKNESVFKKLGIDVTISSTDLILEHIEHEVPTHPLTHLSTLQAGGFEIVNVRIPPGSAVVGKRIRDIDLPSGSLISLIIDPEKGPMLPDGDTVLSANDDILAVTKAEVEASLRAALTGF